MWQRRGREPRSRSDPRAPAWPQRCRSRRCGRRRTRCLESLPVEETGRLVSVHRRFPQYGRVTTRPRRGDAPPRPEPILSIVVRRPSSSLRTASRIANRRSGHRERRGGDQRATSLTLGTDFAGAAAVRGRYQVYYNYVHARIHGTDGDEGDRWATRVIGWRH